MNNELDKILVGVVIIVVLFLAVVGAVMLFSGNVNYKFDIRCDNVDGHDVFYVIRDQNLIADEKIAKFYDLDRAKAFYTTMVATKAAVENGD